MLASNSDFYVNFVRVQIRDRRPQWVINKTERMKWIHSLLVMFLL
jgi:hypothetical protein